MNGVAAILAEPTQRVRCSPCHCTTRNTQVAPHQQRRQPQGRKGQAQGKMVHFGIVECQKPTKRPG